MKKTLIVILIAVFAAGACGTRRQNSPSDQIVSGKIVSVKGTVTEIERGKDGYTARIKAADGQIYSAVVSAVNLGRAQYKEVKVGDAVEVTGEDVLGDGKTIKVTVLK